MNTPSYLGRKIKDHNLLQALTRVNRPYKKMRYGFVVDFADIQEEFDKTNQAYLKELQEEIGENFETYQKIFKTQEEIENDLNFIREKLFSFDTDNAEIFSEQIKSVEDIKFLRELRRAVELYKENFNLVENYGYSDLKNLFDIKKIFNLSKIINSRLDTLRQKEIFNNPDDISALVSLAIDNLEFSFKKISEQEMHIADEFLNVRRKICREFEINADKKDSEYLALVDELKRILEKNNIEEMTAAEMQNQKIFLENLRKKIHDLNEKNNRLTLKYLGDKKFMRIHKKIAKTSPPQKIFEILISIKNLIDDKLFRNYAVLENKNFFEKEILRLLMQVRKNFSLTSTADEIKTLGEIIAQEYFDERNAK